MPALAGVWCGVGVRPRLLAPLSHGTGRGSPRSFSSFSTRKRLRCFHSSSPAICAAGRSGGGTGETLLPGERGERQHQSFHENKAAPAFPSHPNSTQGGQLQLASPAAIAVFPYQHCFFYLMQSKAGFCQPALGRAVEKLLYYLVTVPAKILRSIGKLKPACWGAARFTSQSQSWAEAAHLP